MSFTTLIIVLVTLLIALFSLTSVNSAFRRLQKRETKRQLNLTGKWFFYRYIHKLCFDNHEYEGLFFATTSALNLFRFFYVFFSFFLLLRVGLVGSTVNPFAFSPTVFIQWPIGVLDLTGLFFIFFIISDYLPRLLGTSYPNFMIRLNAPISSIFLTLSIPLTYLFLKLSHFLSNHTSLNFFLDLPHAEAKQEIIQMIEEANTEHALDWHDKELVESVIGFKDRIAREIMVPRVDVFSLPDDTTIEEAAAFLQNEGYSRTPVYKDTLDNIIGVLMYKDVLTKYMEYVRNGNDLTILQAPIETLVKSVLYTPETKKISHLLQEFRKNQVHLAIIVDEYGGTEGIVTIEDILEEIVGDIADEYDKEEVLFVKLPEDGWLIDARMSILDIEEHLGIDIPQDGDYDTIGGYIFHEAGTIPPKGFTIKQPDFELEVLRSNDRRVEKIRITPLINPINEEQNQKK